MFLSLCVGMLIFVIFENYDINYLTQEERARSTQVLTWIIRKHFDRGCQILIFQTEMRLSVERFIWNSANHEISLWAVFFFYIL